MSIEFNCPQCLSPTSLDDRFEGCAVNCDECGRSIIVPMRAAANGKLPDVYAPSILQLTRLCGPMGLLATGFALAAVAFVIYVLVGGNLKGAYLVGAVCVYLLLLAGGGWAGVRALVDGEEGMWLVYTALGVLLLPMVTLAVIASTVFLIRML